MLGFICYGFHEIRSEYPVHAADNMPSGILPQIRLNNPNGGNNPPANTVVKAPNIPPKSMVRKYFKRNLPISTNVAVDNFLSVRCLTLIPSGGSPCRIGSSCGRAGSLLSHVFHPLLFLSSFHLSSQVVLTVNPMLLPGGLSRERAPPYGLCADILSQTEADLEHNRDRSKRRGVGVGGDVTVDCGAEGP